MVDDADRVQLGELQVLKKITTSVPKKDTNDSYEVHIVGVPTP